MPTRLLMTLGLLVPALLIPFLEVNHTHVFNADWPQHARFHNVWQLLTNTGLAVFCLWLVWARRQITLAAAIGGWIMGTVVIAQAMGPLYDGYVTYEGGSTLAAFGLPFGVLVPLASVAMFVVAVLLARRADAS